jgi:hypothetical protein
MRFIESRQRDSSSTRVPTVPVGEALIVTRYSEEKAVVLNPTDFHQLVEITELLEDVQEQMWLTPSDTAVRARELEDRPTTQIEDPDEIRALLGL